jgi:hypothetical protein
MKVRELIERLSACDQEAVVKLADWNTAGPWQWHDDPNGHIVVEVSDGDVILDVSELDE